jgi:hypothetical protein
VKAFLLPAALSALAVAGPLVAGPDDGRDLGESLVYVRMERVTAESAALPAAPSLVLDLRYAAGDDAAAAALQAKLRGNPAGRRLVLVLANPETAAPLRRILEPAQRPARALVLGRAGENFEPDIPVVFDAEAERSAWAAGGTGDLTELITDNPGKIRLDEAAIVRRHQNGGPEDGEPPAAAAAGAAVTDRVLQRAVQLHRGLNALPSGRN